MMSTPLERAAQWRERAQAYRAVAQSITDMAAKAVYLDVAKNYGALADHAESEGSWDHLKPILVNGWEANDAALQTGPTAV
jgi:hypothetical protein